MAVPDAAEFVENVHALIEIFDEQPDRDGTVVIEFGRERDDGRTERREITKPREIEPSPWGDYVRICVDGDGRPGVSVATRRLRVTNTTAGSQAGRSGSDETADAD